MKASKKAISRTPSSASGSSVSSTPTAQTSATSATGPTVPPLLPYNYKRRGAFNFLRHRDQPAMLPKKPDLEKTVGTSVKEKWVSAGESGVELDNFGNQLMRDPLIDFDLWRTEYNNQLVKKDIEAMREMIWKQERQMKLDETSVSSDSYHVQKGPRTPPKSSTKVTVVDERASTKKKSAATTSEKKGK